MPITLGQLEIALLWMESNEGTGEEKEACEAGAAFLRQEIEKREAKRLKGEIATVIAAAIGATIAEVKKSDTFKRLVAKRD